MYEYSFGGGGIQRGTKLSEETRKKMSKPRTEEHRRHISEGCIGRAGKYEKTEEHRIKLSKFFKGKTTEEILGEEGARTCKEKKSKSLKNFWKENPNSENIRKLKSEALKEAWIERRKKPQKKRIRKKPFSMTPAAIRLRESRQQKNI